MKVIVGPYQWAKSHQNSPHLIRPNFTSIVLEQNANMSVEEDEVLMWASASLFGGNMPLPSFEYLTMVFFQ